MAANQQPSNSRCSASLKCTKETSMSVSNKGYTPRCVQTSGSCLLRVINGMSLMSTKPVLFVSSNPPAIASDCIMRAFLGPRNLLICGNASRKQQAAVVFLLRTYKSPFPFQHDCSIQYTSRHDSSTPRPLGACSRMLPSYVLDYHVNLRQTKSF
jgi:hypothetical protein